MFTVYALGLVVLYALLAYKMIKDVRGRKKHFKKQHLDILRRVREIKREIYKLEEVLRDEYK